MLWNQQQAADYLGIPVEMMEDFAELAGLNAISGQYSSDDVKRIDKSQITCHVSRIEGD